MEILPRADDPDDASLSDDDDLRLFGSIECHDPERFAGEILCMKHNDPELESLSLICVDDSAADERDGVVADHRAFHQKLWRRLEHILGRSEHLRTLDLAECRLSEWGWLGRVLGRSARLEHVEIYDCNLDAVSVDGLQNNLFIQELRLGSIDLGDNEMITTIARFSSHNPSLREIALENCNLGPAGLDFLSDALLNRSDNTLECLHLNANNFGDVDLDKLANVVKRNENFSELSLYDNGIGPKGCASIARLLQDPGSSLIELYLGGNSMDDDAVGAFAASLDKNTKLINLDLGDCSETTTAAGWSTMPKIVCNGSSIKDVIDSNHIIAYLGDITFDEVLGADDADLLDASLDLNGESDKALVVRHKVLWCHARGDLNIGQEPSVPLEAMPSVLARIGDDSDEARTNLIQYSKRAEVGIVRLDSFYRILRSRPSILRDGCSQGGENARCGLDEERPRDEVKKLRGEVRDEIENIEEPLQAGNISTRCS